MNSTSMTEDQLIDQTIAAFAAWRKDKITKLEYSKNGGPWMDSWEASWGNPIFHYRIKPEPKLRPWTKDEARGKWVRRKYDASEWLITGVGSGQAWVASNWRSMSDLLSDFTQLDDSPCGVQE